MNDPQPVHCKSIQVPYYYFNKLQMSKQFLTYFDFKFSGVSVAVGGDDSSRCLYQFPFLLCALWAL